MFAHWLKKKKQITLINQLLIDLAVIQIKKTIDPIKIGLHKYSFSIQSDDGDQIIMGTGTDFNEDLSVLKAWGEFVERYSFFQDNLRNHIDSTSNGYAAHSLLSEAKQRALAELIERDVFLSSWLLGLPAKRIKLDSLPTSLRFRHVLARFRKMGIYFDVGILGKCMGFYVGIVMVQSNNYFSISTASQRSFKSLIQQLITEGARQAINWLSPGHDQTSYKDVGDLSNPLDHYYYYLKRGHDYKPRLFTDTDELMIYPDFEFEINDLTSCNDYALASNYYVCQAYSSKAQNLWFGKTTDHKINFDRLTQITGRKINHETLNYEPHPLA